MRYNIIIITNIVIQYQKGIPLGEGGRVKGLKIVLDLFKPILLFPNYEKWVLTTKWVNN